MRLRPYPGTNAPEDLILEAEAYWTGKVLKLDYYLSGPFSLIKKIQSVDLAHGARKDELWKTTCFEAFIHAEGSRAYWELNFATSGEWAFYRFDDYRRDQTNPEIAAVPSVHTNREKGWHCQVLIDLGDQRELVHRPLMFSPCAVLEDMDGTITYWAVEHHREKPDFHHPDRYVRLLLPQENA